MTTDYYTATTNAHNVFIPHSLEAVNQMRRVLVLGSSGSGKSTFARRLGATLELPVIHLDRHFWHSGWVGTPWEEWTETVKLMLQREQWIMDGNYRRTLDTRLAVADTAIFIDLPKWLCAYRAIKRRIQYRNTPRPDIAAGCKERLFDPNFPQFIRHIFDYPNRAKPDVQNRLAQLPDNKRVIWLKSTSDVSRFLINPFDPVFIKRPKYKAFPPNSPPISPRELG